MGFKYSIPKRQRAGKIYTQEELYREYYPIFMKMLMTRGRGVMDAEDIAHNAFVYIYTIWDTIKWEMVENLISLILYQTVVRFYRDIGMEDNITGGSNYIELVDSSLVNDPFDIMVIQSFRKTLQNAFSVLSKREREVFYGYYFENKTTVELSGGKSHSTIRNQLSNAREKVSEYFSVNYTRD